MVGYYGDNIRPYFGGLFFPSCPSKGAGDGVWLSDTDSLHLSNAFLATRCAGLWVLWHIAKWDLYDFDAKKFRLCCRGWYSCQV